MAGHISQISILQVRLRRWFSLKARPLLQTETEVIALMECVRYEAETAGALVLPDSSFGTDWLELTAVFRGPVPLFNSALRALEVAQRHLQRAQDQKLTMALELPMSAAIVSGYAEVSTDHHPNEYQPYHAFLETLNALQAEPSDLGIVFDQATEVLLHHQPGSDVTSYSSLLAASRKTFGLNSLPEHFESVIYFPLFARLLLLSTTLLVLPSLVFFIVSSFAWAIGHHPNLLSSLHFHQALGIPAPQRLLLTILAALFSLSNLIIFEVKTRSLSHLQIQARFPLHLPRRQIRRLLLLRSIVMLVGVLLIVEILICWL